MGRPQEESAMNPIRNLVIGYGNVIRSDDGVGVQVAEAMEALALPGVEVIACHQLTPDLAEPMARADRVIFADARPVPEHGAPELEVFAVEPRPAPGFGLHRGDPADLAALAMALYGRCPPTWCVAIPTVQFDLGDQLSDVARQGVRDAVAAITRLVARPPAAAGEG